MQGINSFCRARMTCGSHRREDAFVAGLSLELQYFFEGHHLAWGQPST